MLSAQTFCFLQNKNINKQLKIQNNQNYFNIYAKLKHLFHKNNKIIKKNTA